MERTQYDWGFEIVLWKEKNLTVKLIHVDYKQHIELHKHLYKRELIVDEGLNSYLLEPGQAHMLTCDSEDGSVEFVEVSIRESKFDKINIGFNENNKKDT